MSGRGHHAAWADDNSGLDTFDVGHVFDEATRSYNLPPDAGWSERLEVERGSARVRLNKSSGFMGAIVRNQQDRQAYEAAWRDSLAQEPSAFRRQHGVGIRVDGYDLPRGARPRSGRDAGPGADPAESGGGADAHNWWPRPAVGASPGTQVTLVQRRAPSEAHAGGSGAAATSAASPQAAPAAQQHAPPGYAGASPPGCARTPPHGRPRPADPIAPAAAPGSGVQGWPAEAAPDQAAGGGARHAERQAAFRRLAAAGAPDSAQAAGAREPDQAGATAYARGAARAPVEHAGGGSRQWEPDRGGSEGPSHGQGATAAQRAAAADGAAGFRAGAAWHPERAAPHERQHSQAGPGVGNPEEHEAPQPRSEPAAGSAGYNGWQGAGAQPGQGGQGYFDPGRWQQAAGGGAQAQWAQPPASQQPDWAVQNGAAPAAAAGLAPQPQWQVRGGAVGDAGGPPWQALGGALGGPGALQSQPWAWQRVPPQAPPVSVPVVQGTPVYPFLAPGAVAPQQFVMGAPVESSAGAPAQAQPQPSAQPQGSWPGMAPAASGQGAGVGQQGLQRAPLGGYAGPGAPAGGQGSESAQQGLQRSPQDAWPGGAPAASGQGTGFSPAGSGQQPAPQRQLSRQAPRADAPPFVPGQSLRARQAPPCQATAAAQALMMQQQALDQVQQAGAVPAPGAWAIPAPDPGSRHWAAQGAQEQPLGDRGAEAPAYRGPAAPRPEARWQSGAGQLDGWHSVRELPQGGAAAAPADGQPEPDGWQGARAAAYAGRGSGAGPAPAAAQPNGAPAGDDDRFWGGADTGGAAERGVGSWEGNWGGPSGGPAQRQAGKLAAPPGKSERVRVGFQPYRAPPVFSERAAAPHAPGASAPDAHASAPGHRLTQAVHAHAGQRAASAERASPPPERWQHDKSHDARDAPASAPPADVRRGSRTVVPVIADRDARGWAGAGAARRGGEAPETPGAGGPESAKRGAPGGDAGGAGSGARRAVPVLVVPRLGPNQVARGARREASPARQPNERFWGAGEGPGRASNPAAAEQVGFGPATQVFAPPQQSRRSSARAVLCTPPQRLPPPLTAAPAPVGENSLPARHRRPLSAVVAELSWVERPTLPHRLTPVADIAPERSWGTVESLANGGSEHARAPHWDDAAQAAADAAAALAEERRQAAAARAFSRPGYWTGSGGSAAPDRNGVSAALPGGSSGGESSSPGPGPRRSRAGSSGAKARDRSPRKVVKAAQARAPEAPGLAATAGDGRARSRSAQGEKGNPPAHPGTAAPNMEPHGCTPAARAAGQPTLGQPARPAEANPGPSPSSAGARPSPLPGQHMALAQAALRAAGVRGSQGARLARARAPVGSAPAPGPGLGPGLGPAAGQHAAQARAPSGDESRPGPGSGAAGAPAPTSGEPAPAAGAAKPVPAAGRAPAADPPGAARSASAAEERSARELALVPLLPPPRFAAPDRRSAVDPAVEDLGGQSPEGAAAAEASPGAADAASNGPRPKHRSRRTAQKLRRQAQADSAALVPGGPDAPGVPVVIVEGSGSVQVVAAAVPPASPAPVPVAQAPPGFPAGR